MSKFKILFQIVVLFVFFAGVVDFALTESKCKSIKKPTTLMGRY